ARLNFKPGKDVAVIGAGSIGNLTIQCLKLMGARKVYVFDIVDKKLDLARKFGADYCYNTSDEGYFEQFVQDSNELGVEQVIEMVGLEATVLLSMKVCSVGGTISIVGNLGNAVNIS